MRTEPGHAEFTAEAFVDRAVRESRLADRGDYGDHRFNPGHPRLDHGRRLRDAAVLVPVVDRSAEATVILTRRAASLRDHSGQVAFPGGRIDPEDLSAEAAALREAQEEIGLLPDFVDIVGRMPDYVSGSGYRIAPVLSVVRPGFLLSPNPAEVDAVFEVPLRFLMDPANHHRNSRVFGDREWMFYDMSHGGERIWGVTAGIIRTVYERLYG